jgi:uncharacterized protein YeaO (DUF488 family)
MTGDPPIEPPRIQVARIQVARIYEPRSPSVGYRVLVDRLWPRGLTKVAADIDEWCRDIAPSTTLRRWYGHRETRFAEFRDRYLSELDDDAHSQALSHLRAITTHHELILLTAVQDLRLGHARVLAERLSWGRATEVPVTGHVHVKQQSTAQKR